MTLIDNRDHFGTTYGTTCDKLLFMETKKVKITGEGSIVEVERGRKYRIRFRLPQDETGKRKWSKQKTVIGTKAQARMALEEYRTELEEELNNSHSDLTVGEYAEEFQQLREDVQTLSPLSIERDKIEIARIVENFGDVPLQKLNITDISRVYAKLRKEGISKSALHKLHQKLKQIMAKAVAEEIITRNPCDGITDVHRPAPKQRKALSRDQAIQLAKDLKSEERNGKIVAVWLALATGMRRGEALGLVWGNVDFEHGILRITQQLDKRGELREPKSETSKRPLHIDDGTVQFLSEWKNMQSEYFFNSEPVPDDFPVCCNSQLGRSDTNFLSTSVFDKWRRAFFIEHGLAHYKKEVEWVDSRGIKRVRKIGYEGFNFHELRHTQATLLIGSGADFKTVQNRLGHSTPTLTLATYAHAIPQNDKEAADFIGGFLS